MSIEVCGATADPWRDWSGARCQPRDRLHSMTISSRFHRIGPFAAR
jgi:hypothetical protein